MIKPRYAENKMISSSWEELRQGRNVGKQFLHLNIFWYFFSRLFYSLARNKKNTPTRSAKKNSKKQIKHWGDQDWKAGKEKKNKMAVGYSVYFPVFYISLLSSNLLKLTKKNLSIWLINDKILLALENWYSRRIVFLSLFQGGLGFKLVPLVLLPPRRTLPLPRRWRLGTADIPTPDRSCWIRPR